MAVDVFIKRHSLLAFVKVLVLDFGLPNSLDS